MLAKVWNAHFESILKCAPSRSTLVVDSASAELLHWQFVNSQLTDKFSDIKYFSSFSQISNTTEAVSILIDNIISKDTYQTIQDIIRASSSVTRYVIITPFSENFHASFQSNQQENLQNFDGIKYKLRAIPGGSRIVDIQHIPFQSAFIDEAMNFFVTPSFTATSLSEQFAEFTNTIEPSSSSILDSLPSNFQLGVKKFCGNFWRLMTDMEAQAIPFSVGKTSRIISEHLASIPAPKSATNKFAVVFIDRCLDLVAPLQPSDRCFADQVYKCFPELSENSSDLQIPINQMILKHIKIPGCLSNPNNATHQAIFRKLFTGKKKELQNASIRILNEICTKGDIKISEKINKASFENAEKLLRAIETNRKVLMENISVVSVVIAIWLACEDKSFDEKYKLQKLFNQQFQDVEPSFDSVCDLLVNIIESECDNLSMDDSFAFVVSCFSLCEADESYFPREKVSKLFAALLKKSVVRKEDDKGDENSVARFLNSEDDFMKLLACVSTSRGNLVDYVSLFEVEDTIPTYKPLVEQIAEDIFKKDPNKTLNDIVCATAITNLKSLIKTSFSYFMPVSKPRPSDYPNIIFFVVGGITPAEIKMIKDSALMYNSTAKVYIGSNKILGHPSTILNSLAEIK